MVIVKCSIPPIKEKTVAVECKGKEYNPFTNEVQEYRLVRFLPANTFKCYSKLVSLHERAVGKPTIDDKVLYAFVCTPRSMIKHELPPFTGRVVATNAGAIRRLLNTGILFDTLQKTKGNKEIMAPPEIVEELCKCSYRDFIPQEIYERLTEEDIKRFVQSITEKKKEALGSEKK